MKGNATYDEVLRKLETGKPVYMGWLYDAMTSAVELGKSKESLIEACLKYAGKDGKDPKETQMPRNIKHVIEEVDAPVRRAWKPVLTQYGIA